MKPVPVTLAVLLALSVAGPDQVEAQGFLQGVRNFFRPARQTQQARPAFRPNQRPNQQFQPQPNQFQQQPPQQQNNQQIQPQQPAFQPQQPQPFRPQPQQQQQPQPQFVRRPVQNQPQQQFNSRPVQNTQTNFVNNPRPQFTNNRPVNNNIQPQQQVRGARPSSSSGAQFSNAPVCEALPREDLNDREGPTRCPDGLAPAFQFRGKNIILTWKEDSHPFWNEGCRNFTGIQADNYCRAQGGRAASLDDNEAAELFMKQSAIYAQRYYWTGGRLNHKCGVLQWPSGKSEGWNKGQRFWSHTGGSKSKGPQPDNRHELEDGHPGEPEKCLGILNNFYADGIKWHDVACHHRKPTICEVPI